MKVGLAVPARRQFGEHASELIQPERKRGSLGQQLELAYEIGHPLFQVGRSTHETIPTI
jgi:hypothetical protein